MTTRTVVKLPVNGKSVSALVGVLGSAAVLCNVGMSPAALLRGNQPSGAGPDPSRSASLPDIDRADTIMERLLSIPEENDRYLMFGHKALENNYYTQLGDGFCAAADFSLYDHVSNQADSAAECAKFCGKHLLYTEHRGFNYADHNKDCQCIFDNFRIPRPLQKKSAEVVLAPHGEGKVLHTTLASTDGSGYQCYKKNDETVGGSIDWYSIKDCATDDGEVLDIVSFTAFTSDTCADICGRFSLMRTHRGFTVTIEGHCRCLFKEGEMPTERKLSNSGAERHESLTFQERFGQFITPGETKCYDKTERNQQAPANVPRVQGDASNRVFINEFHFRNFGTNEPFVRVVGPKGTDEGDEEASIQEDRPHVKDVDELPPAIPKLVHLVTILPGGTALPPYWSQAVTYSRERSAAQGYETRLWTLPDADAAVREHYPPFVVEAWDRVSSTGQGARMADFFRVAAVHTFGGVFLDLDMIPCRGLDELAGPDPAAASFPFTQSVSGQVSNAAFAAPAGHEVLKIALDLMASNERLATEHVLSATGPHMLALAVKMYAEAHGLESSVPSLYDKEEMPRGHSWLAEGGIRLGTFRYEGPKDPGTEMSLCHLAFASWMVNREPFRSKCEKETELVPSFIDANCRGTVCKMFSECGKV